MGCIGEVTTTVAGSAAVFSNILLTEDQLANKGALDSDVSLATEYDDESIALDVAFNKPHQPPMAASTSRNDSSQDMRLMSVDSAPKLPRRRKLAISHRPSSPSLPTPVHRAHCSVNITSTNEVHKDIKRSNSMDRWSPHPQSLKSDRWSSTNGPPRHSRRATGCSKLSVREGKMPNREYSTPDFLTLNNASNSSTISDLTFSDLSALSSSNSTLEGLSDDCPVVNHLSKDELTSKKARDLAPNPPARRRKVKKSVSTPELHTPFSPAPRSRKSVQTEERLLRVVPNLDSGNEKDKAMLGSHHSHDIDLSEHYFFGCVDEISAVFSQDTLASLDSFT
jgi:hypothetical protein